MVNKIELRVKMIKDAINEARRDLSPTEDRELLDGVSADIEGWEMGLDDDEKSRDQGDA